VRGRLRAADVLAAGDTPGDVLAWLERHDQHADTMFRVPVDPAVDLLGQEGFLRWFRVVIEAAIPSVEITSDVSYRL